MDKDFEEEKSHEETKKPIGYDDRNAKERLYDRINIPLKVLDKIIWGLIALLVIVAVLGILKGNGFF